MFEKSPADAYHKAIKALPKAETKHRANLDALDAALHARDPHQVTPLRKACEKSENELQAALQAAHGAHRAYWSARRDELRDEIENAANAVLEYDALARLAGDRSPSPGMQLLQAAIANGKTAEPLIEDVPSEEPDSALLDDFRGSWRA